ncbi:PaaI family thioesterase [Variovorax sp. PCZ-1]|uniref:PaaI family thioesterase n=1 Tax=Variovorax sp. PCZ-1 TaxID=2835533 RepID=UPI001BCD41FA|nr:PaaI family thioesterase [Variovorax sp. PCZ-1]MBS7807246.1 PaaI family thioesterase [Variovorax sp. PCZ-1]
MSALYERIETSFKRQGMMQALGCELVSVDKGRVEFALPMSEKVTQQQGAFHGGALGALADISCGYAALTVAPEGMEVTSVEYKINFAAAASGERVHCVGEVKRAGRTLAVCQAELFDVKDGERKSCGFMQATMIYIEKKY